VGQETRTATALAVPPLLQPHAAHTAQRPPLPPLHPVLCNLLGSLLEILLPLLLVLALQLFKLEYKSNQLRGEDKFHSTPVKAPPQLKTRHPAL